MDTDNSNTQALVAGNVLLIEDDVKLANKIQRFLELHDYDVTWMAGGAFVPLESNINVYQFIICDIDLPDISGYDILTNIRDNFLGTFIFITALNQTHEQIRGLELGSDDYIVKPFAAEILLARMQAASRRNARLMMETPQTESAYQSIELEGMTISPKDRIVTIQGEKLKLTEKEFSTLYLLVQEIEHTVARSKIHKVVLGKEYDGFDRTIDVHVSALRKKFNQVAGNPYQINAVWGKGYILIKM